jgi:hypothetical protein
MIDCAASARAERVVLVWSSLIRFSQGTQRDFDKRIAKAKVDRATYLGLSLLADFLYYKNLGAYGARTRNLRRDRAAL